MESTFHRWWLGSCVAALLLASWAGGFSLAVTSVFIVIYLTGVTLIGPDVAPAEPVDVVAAEPVDVVAAEPVDVVAAEPVDAVTDEPSDAPSEQAQGDEDESPAEEPAEDTAEDTADEVSAQDPLADGSPAEDDDAMPYPDDFEEAARAVDRAERSPA